LSDIEKYESFEKDATFIGVVCIKDPVRPEVKPAI
jgi:magnesium-transporting ATPase (P-type)